MAIYERVGDPGRENSFFQGTPGALVQDIVLRYLCCLLQIGNDKVGKITLPDKTSFLDLETDCRSVTHFLHYLFKTDPAFPNIMQHQ